MKKILIIEDDPITGKIYYTQFEKAGYRVDLAADGQEGYYKVQEGRYDAVLLDLMLPNMSGLEILRKIRAQKHFQKLVVVVFTNSFLSEMFDAANEAGANRIFHKSNLSPKDLIEVMNQELYLSRRSAFRNAGPEEADLESPGEPAAAYRQELIETFLKRAPDTIAALERADEEFKASMGREEAEPKLLEYYRRLHAFSGVAGLAGLKRLVELCVSMEALLVEMHENPVVNMFSTRRTLSRAIEFLKRHFQDLADLPESTDRSARVLVVDDQLMSRRAASFALDFGGFEVATHEDARASLELLSKRGFHLIVLDEGMPGLTGSEVIRHIRKGPPNQRTPVILVLDRPEFEKRAAELPPASVEFIARPYPYAELGVKALMLLLSHRILDVQPLKMPGTKD